MVAQAATPDRMQSARRDPALASLGQAALVSATLAFLLVAAWLCGRRLSGGLPQPLGALPLLGVAVFTAVLISGLRCGWWQAGVWPVQVRSRPAVWWTLPALAALILATAVSLRGGSTTALALLWVILLAHEALWGVFLWRARPDWKPSSYRQRLPPPPRMGWWTANPTRARRRPAARFR